MKKTIKSVAGVVVSCLALYAIFGCILPRIYDPFGAVFNSEDGKKMRLYNRDWIGRKTYSDIELRMDKQLRSMRWMHIGDDGKWHRINFLDNDFPDEQNVN